ncbi:MAG: SDR family NAD(P)-dependent oxidoreductase, partial [Alphaproteobacteria bacterium]
MKTVLITGGTSGIGEVTARAFKDAGYNVVVNNISGGEDVDKFTEETGIP